MNAEHVELWDGELPVDAKRGLNADSAKSAEELLLSEISRLGGRERMNAARGALAVFETTRAELVQKDPKTYGAGDDPESQRRAVAELTGSVRVAFLRRTVETMRHKDGYVLIGGRWVHRAVFTFVGFGLLAAGLIPACAVSLMSDSQWGWLPGVTAIVIALGAGAWILSRVRSR